MTNELKELESVARALNEESDEINTTITTLNAKLAALTIGLEVWLGLDEDHYQIGYANVDEEWQIATGYCEEFRWVEEPGWPEGSHYEPVQATDFTLTPLLQEARELRIRGLRHIKALYRELCREAERGLGAIREAKKLAEEL